MKIIDVTIGMEKEIIELQKYCYQENAERYQDYSIAPLKETEDELTIAIKDSVILVAVERDTIIGSIRANTKNGTCYIGRVIVHPEYQNKGIGKSLMNAIEARFPEVDRFELFTGHNDDKNLYFYKRNGYNIFESKKLTANLTLVYLEKIRNPTTAST